MKAIAIYNTKGGVGKTTTAVNLSYLAAHSGLRILLWDLDPQGASTFAFRVQPHVSGLEKRSLENGHALRAAVTNIAGKDRVFTLLNRANRAGGLPRATIVKALGAEPDMVIPDLGKGMTQAVNLGIPALKHVRGLRRYLAPIVREIAGVGAQRKGWLRRLFR